MSIIEMKEAIAEQVLLLDSLAVVERELQRYAYAQAWDVVEATLPRIGELADAFERAEARRHQAHLALRAELGCRECPFSAVLALLGETDRRELSELYRRLKVGIMRVKSLTSGIDIYVDARLRAGRELLEQIVPGWASPVYGADGRKLSIGASIVSHHM